MLKLTLAAALFAAAQAACPNMCSGHGHCDENDRCICFKAPGTTGNLRDAYTGADCSLRVCPYGRSHDIISDATQEFLPVRDIGAMDDASTKYIGFIKDAATGSQHKLRAFLNNGFLLNRDTGVDIKVVSVSSGAPATAKFQWKLNTEKTFNKEETMSVGGDYTSKAQAYHLQPDTDGDGETEYSGLYLYFDISNNADITATPSTSLINAGDRYYLNVTFNEGMNLKRSDLNTAHGFIECAGRGLCDRTAGVCKCVAGYGGDACQRTECPNDCSGHGTCQSLKYFVLEAAHTYAGYDAEGQMGCKCDSGFRGADCSQIECPSGDDPLMNSADANAKTAARGADCSGRGICDYTVGLCQCFRGYYGERCEEQTNLV